MLMTDSDYINGFLTTAHLFPSLTKGYADVIEYGLELRVLDPD
jgi:hypothetical protein